MRYIFYSFLLLFCGASYAQLSIDNFPSGSKVQYTPKELAETVLVIPNPLYSYAPQTVFPTGVIYNKAAAKAIIYNDQIGKWETNLNAGNLGLGSNEYGVLLTTGKTEVAFGPNDIGSDTAISTIPIPVQDDPDLQILAGLGNSIKNISILEFDFVAQGYSVSFDYVFGSEEYPEYIDSQFNDAFGFFLSGSGIAGGMGFTNNAVNLAVIPISNTGNDGVTIANVNHVRNKDYYVSNGNGSTPAINTYTQYDGFTKLLTAKYVGLLCGQTYHIKLAIANVGDNTYDSGVFLKNFAVAPPKLTIYGIENNPNICGGVPEPIKIVGDFPSDAIYSWTLDGAPLPDTGSELIPTTSGQYCVTIYTAAPSNCLIGSDCIDITVLPAIDLVPPENLSVCTSLPPPYSPPFTFDINQTSLMLSNVNAADYTVTYYNSSFQDAFDGVPTGRIPNVDLASYPLATASATIWVRVESLVNGCVNVPSFTLDAIQNSVAPTVTSPVVYCLNASAAPLTAIGTNLLWYTVATGGTGDTNAPTPQTITAGDTNYYVSQSIGGCEGPRASITVTVNAPPLAPVVATPVTYCQNATPTQLTAIGTDLLWYNVASGGTGNTSAPTPNTTIIGDTNYYVSQTVNGCEGPRAEIVVKIIALPSAPTVTTPVVYCQFETATPLTAGGSNLLWYTQAVGGTGTTTAPTPSTLVVGDTNYYVSQSIIGCEAPRALIVVSVLPSPAEPTVTSPVNYCLNAPATSLIATGTNLLWYDVPTGGTGSTNAPTPNTNIAGDVTYYVTQSVSGCESKRASILVSVISPPSAPVVTSPIGYCQFATAVPLTATGTDLLWYTTATGGTGSSVAPIPSTTTIGSTNYYVSQTVNGCEGPRALIDVAISASPLAPVVTSPVIYCQNYSASALTATGTNLLWYTVATGGTANTIAPIPSTTTPGDTTYYVSQTVSGCEGPRAPILVTILPTPNAPTVTSPVNYCLNATAVPLTAVGTSLLWYDLPSGGIGSTTVPTPITSVAGNTNYYVSQTINGCEGPRANIIVNVIAPPSAPIVTSAVGYCQFTTAVPLTATGTDLLWYTTATGGIGSSIAPIPSTTTIGNTDYYVSQSVSGCEGPRALIVVTISASPLAPVVSSPVLYCQNDTPIVLSAAGTNLLWYTVATGGTGNTVAPIPSTTVSGNTNYYVSQTINNCEGPRAVITVIVTPTPTPTLEDGFVCVDGVSQVVTSDYTLNSGLSTLTYNFEWYEIVAGVPNVIPSQTSNVYVVTAPGTYGVRAENKTTKCISEIVTANVVVSSPPTAIEVTTSNYFAQYQTITVDASPAGDYVYQIDNGSFQTSNVFNNVSSGEHKIVVKDSEGCGEIIQFVNTIDYPKFFTPNGDGYNDTWNISTLSNQPNAKISIFDKFGKLIQQIRPSGPGWDGSYNGKNLPSTDYWFHVNYLESGAEKIFRAHFTLKR